MSEKLYSIGEVAKIANITIKALRHYDKINLFKPAYVDPHSNYRYYKDSQLYHLDLIKSLSYIGISLKEIKLVQEISNDDYISFLIKQEETVKEKLDYLLEVQQIISSTREELQKQRNVLKLNEVLHLEMAEMQIIQTKVTDLGPTTVLNSSYSKLKSYRASTEGFRRNGYGSIIPYKHYDQLTEITYQHLFTPVFSEKQIVSLHQDAELSIIPKGNYLSITTKSTSFEEYFSTFQQLMSYVKEKQIEITSNLYEFFNVVLYEGKEEYLSEFRVRI